MMTRWIVATILPLCALGTLSACNKASFGQGGGKKANGIVTPNGTDVKPANEPLNLAEEEANKPAADAGGPKGAEGQVLDKTVELDCDTAPGGFVEIGEPGQFPKLHLMGKTPTETTPIDQNGEPTGKGGGKDTGKGGGKDDGGKDGGIDGDEPLPELPEEEIPEQTRVHVRVKGKFCPKSSRKLTVMFVVDHSGSMGRHIPGEGLPEVPGNDPQVNGSCGRLRAAEAIMKKLAAEVKPGDEVELGMIPFAGGIVVKKIIPITAMTSFRAHINKDVFCQYVVQNPSFGHDPVNPGGIDGGGLFGFGGVDASTNYKAAFRAAESILAPVYGRKEVYFISDGEPTSGGADPTQAGIDAGNSLRTHVSNLTLNALLLGSPRPAAQTVLEQVAGSPDRVRKADNADELAAKILEFPSAGIDETTGKAFLTVDPYPRADLGLRYLQKDPAVDGVWIYETQPFVLLGKPGQEVVNLVEITALGKDGSTHKASVKLRYRQKP